MSTITSETGRRSAGDAREPRTARIAVFGNPNTGKTTLFNRFCGLRARTANFPGVTTEARLGRCALHSDGPALHAEMIDLPGVYRLTLNLPEVETCRAVLEGRATGDKPDAALVVVDACNLTRNLFLVADLLATGLPVVVALNMTDIAQRRGLTIDTKKLGERIGCPVVPIVARSGKGLEELRAALFQQLETGERTGPTQHPAAALELPDPKNQAALVDWAEKAFSTSVGGRGAVGGAADTVVERLDQAFTHPILGVLVFAGVMAGLFWSIFAIATVPMDLIEGSFASLGELVANAIPGEGAIESLLVDGVIGGLAGVLVFLPQICLLFFLISLLEDTGYLARAAFVMDRILCRFGLPGQAFVPLLSSHACALPGIMATKLIPDRRDRLATILVAPFMSCSARLPVYVLLTSLLFADRPLLAGLAFAGCYALGATAALFSAFVARRTILKGRSRPMVLELPSYKMPSLRTAFYTTLDRATVFIRNAGTIIMAICVVMWWLSAYPRVEPPAEALRLREQAAARAMEAPDEAASLEARADFVEAKHAQAASFAGRIGRALQPAFEPLGYDWQLTVGVMTSFAAREVFVSTMSVLLVGNAEADFEDEGVISRIRTAQRDDGSPVFTAATSASLLVFYVLAMQCLPTLAVTRRETGSWKWAGLQFVWMTAMAYAFALITFHGLHLLGVA